jgi:hypothetical protein
MTIVVEDGTGLAGAESYCSVAFANAYHAGRGNVAWDVLDDVDQKEPYLRRATDFMLQIYRDRWNGSRASITQALDWPRQLVEVKDAPGLYGMRGQWVTYYATNIVPPEVQRACAELALKAATGELLADLGRPTISEKVGEIEVHYAAGARQTKRYPAIEYLLEPFLRVGSNNIGIVRA